MLPQVLIIYNPRAGMANRLATLEQVAEMWRGHGCAVTLRPTAHAGHATELAREAAAAGALAVLAVGGDGTLNEVANGLEGSETILGPLPAGTGNSLAFEFQMPRPTLLRSAPLIASAERLLAGVVYRSDLIYCESAQRYGLQWTGADAAAIVAERIEPRAPWKKRFGRIGYAVQAMWQLLRLPRWTTQVTVDGATYGGALRLLNISNCRRFVGGMVETQPDARWDDGLLEVVLLETTSLWQMIRAFWQAKRGRLASNPRIRLLRAARVAVTCEPPIPYHIDGEPIGHTPLVCRIAPLALRILAPAGAPHDLFTGDGVPFADVVAAAFVAAPGGGA